MSAPEVVRVTVIVIVGTVTLREEALARYGRDGAGVRVNGKIIPHAKRGIESAPRPPTPEEIGRRGAFPNQHRGTGAVRDIGGTRPGTLIHNTVAPGPGPTRARIPPKRHGPRHREVISQTLQ